MANIKDKLVTVEALDYVYDLLKQNAGKVSIALVDDSQGNFTIQTTGGMSVNLVGDDEGNFILEVT